MNEIYTTGIIGGGVSGAVTALQLAKNGIESVLFEKEKSLVNGPPFCHLHSGGNLYPDISEEQCKVLLKQSIEMAKLFPQSIDVRPTFISVPKTENFTVENIVHRLHILVEHYKGLIKEDASNDILGNPEDYFRLYSKEDLDKLKDVPSVSKPKSVDEWLLNASKIIDCSKLKFPVIMVQEYGWNLFRLGAQAQLALEATEKCNLKTNTSVTEIKDVRDKNLAHNWEIRTKDDLFKIKYLVNSCGFRTGTFDDSLNLKAKRLVEFKASYVSKWDNPVGLIPEIIFHGERGTPHGMAQLTPYKDNHYQIHGMTEEITLFKNGLLSAKPGAMHPKFSDDIEQKLETGWAVSDTNDRTRSAIAFVSNFIPSFNSAVVAGPPLFGAQQIPGDDPSLRVGEVSFPKRSYARSEIIKASSALTVANQIIGKMYEEKVIDLIDNNIYENPLLAETTKNDIDELAEDFAVKRGYPAPIAQLVTERYD
jgi:hypothetical protein